MTPPPPANHPPPPQLGAGRNMHREHLLDDLPSVRVVSTHYHIYFQVSTLMGRPDSTLRNTCQVNKWKVEPCIHPHVMSCLKDGGAVHKQAKSVALIQMADVVKMTVGNKVTGEAMKRFYTTSKGPPPRPSSTYVVPQAPARATSAAKGATGAPHPQQQQGTRDQQPTHPPCLPPHPPCPPLPSLPPPTSSPPAPGFPLLLGLEHSEMMAAAETLVSPPWGAGGGHGEGRRKRGGGGGRKRGAREYGDQQESDTIEEEGGTTATPATRRITTTSIFNRPSSTSRVRGADWGTGRRLDKSMEAAAAKEGGGGRHSREASPPPRARGGDNSSSSRVPPSITFPTAPPIVTLSDTEARQPYAMTNPTAAFKLEISTYEQWCGAPINTDRSLRRVVIPCPADMIHPPPCVSYCPPAC
jgi:hypothetical protein